MNKIFIDGQVGTTGLQIHSRLKYRTDIEIIEIDNKYRKDASVRKEVINSSDVVILCLPDEAAKESVSLIDSHNVRVLDASSAHRVSEGWTYGLPELSKNQTLNISSAQRVSNPGCYPTGAVLLLNPLISTGLLDGNYPYSVNAVSGYTGGGRDAINRFEDSTRSDYISSTSRRYALHHEHKHIKEMQEYSGLGQKPIFQPAYGSYRQGIVLQIPIHLNAHKTGLTDDILRQTLLSYYADSAFIKVLNKSETLNIEGLDPEIHNNTNNITLAVFSPEGTDHVVLAAIYDNLGKGASGAAVQNLEIMLNLVPSDGKVLALD
ncbi:N-acetyl-gamma-glutamyl-phosphate reductase [Photobacterium angustum]|uniref:N-acetyl-gamma-glutamyl-phosphate reductase n=1 Tax=Photobacterium angustum TaxID=661 RepID=A0A2S7VJR5_PHOAN|nr:N-acetyl-gamma-glutamyl-phosphate reductase [Photobacterium angustum]PQJ62288.1 N-acetyl-gamma-glutamyl-phosphate reductase [Photobacterium angustum]